MSEAKLDHRLAAIFSADAVGYTRLLADEEAATIRVLTKAREQIEKSVPQHRGRVIDTAGDNALAEFPSAIDAVRCAVEVQRALADRMAALPADRRMLYRIGLHLGDVAVEGERVYGDGVNVAARLQTLAEPGGICLSAAIHDNVRSRLDLPFHDLGEQSLKNFPRPVRAFRLGGRAPTVVTPPPEPPDRPSLVVLPFANVSADAEQEYFADGMSEDLITELARVPGLFVIGRGTSFSYKGRSVASREIGRELGVRHVVEGSVRRAGARVRITARLTEAKSGQEIWSERYDRELGDVFALQDEVVGGVVAGLRRALGAGIEHTPRGRVVRPEVWELLVQGRAKLERRSPDSGPASHELLLRCVRLDPEFALGWVELARCEQYLHILGAEDGILERGLEHVRHALELDPEEPTAHMTLGLLLGMRGEDEAAAASASARRALELAPGDASLGLSFGTLLLYINRSEEAISVLKNLTRLDPAQRAMHLFQLAACYRRLGRIDEAIAKHRECLGANPDWFAAHMNLAAIHAQLGEMNLARAALAELMRLRPDFSIAKVPRLPTGRDFMVENLRKAGLRE